RRRARVPPVLPAAWDRAAPPPAPPRRSGTAARSGRLSDDRRTAPPCGAPSRPPPSAHPPSARRASPKGSRMSRTTTPRPSLRSTPPSRAVSRIPRRAALAALLLPLAACAADPGQGADPQKAGSTDEGAPSDGGGSAATEDALTVADPWVKASEEGMTSAFG